VPPTTSNATGTGTVLANLATGKILISYITHTVMNATAADIHIGTGAGTTVVAFTNLQPGAGGGGTNLATPPAGAMMSAQNLANFNANLLYFNVDTAANPAGEIRGNIAPLQ
ncbi:MAG TPA: CHRD domain-containing protein, partial [Burkholderiales bacterium]|nr:CHRD domain-containing protein [Burkholderiales bacterium]